MFEAAEVGNRVPKAEYEEQVPGLRTDLLNAQFELRNADFPVLIVIVGDDRAGCNEVVKLLHEWMDPRYLSTHVFGEMTGDEAERPRMWRYWLALPRNGELAIFTGAWALATIQDRLSERIDDAAFDRRIDHIEHLERALVDDGALVLKFWLHLSNDQRKKRLKKARKHPDPRLAVDESDEVIHRAYEDVMPLVERVLLKTGTWKAPWEIVESQDARYRNLTVARSILRALQARLAMEPAEPERPPVPAKPAGAVAAHGVLDTVDLSRSLPRPRYKKEIEALFARLRRLSEQARERGVSSVLVFEGWDAAGKGGIIRRTVHPMDVADYRIVPVAAPTEDERARHYLWRFWRELPRAGRFLIFDRSVYGRVLVERVEGFAREAEWQRAYAEINGFEEQLVEHGMVVLKFWLHLDRDEQLRRFEARAATPFKKYKLTEEDYRNRERWAEYEQAVNDMVERTSTAFAPWHLTPANDKRSARVQVIEAVCDALARRLKHD